MKTPVIPQEVTDATPLASYFLSVVPADYAVVYYSNYNLGWLIRWVEREGLPHEHILPPFSPLPGNLYWSSAPLFFVRFTYKGDTFYVLRWYASEPSKSEVCLLAGPSTEAIASLIRSVQAAREDTTRLHIYGLSEDMREWAEEDWKRTVQGAIPWEGFFMEPRKKELLWKAAWAVFDHPELFTSQGLPPKRGLLLVGPPGNGKTTFIRIFVRDFWNRFPEGHVVILYREEALSSLEDTFTAALGKVAKLSQRGKPTVFVLEDLDCLVTDESLRGAILNALDGMISAQLIRTPSLFIATTNRPERIDPSLSDRPSRFDTVITFPVPDEGLRKEFLAKELGGEYASLVERLASRTSGLSFAHLREIALQAKYLAAYAHRSEVSEEDIEVAAENVIRHHRERRRGFTGVEEVGFGS